LLGDSTANDLRRAMFDQLLKPAKGVSGAYKYLSQVGITVAQGGVLQVDNDKLHAALAADPQAVADLFSAHTQDTPQTSQRVFPDNPGITVINNAPSATFSSLGVAEQMAQLADHFTSAGGGVLTRRGNSLDTEIAAQNQRISDIDARLDDRRTYLQQQFASLESTLADLQRQQASLGQIK
jgi:flagellar capping protein FliD